MPAQFETCAVVGGDHRLMQSGLGAEIDSHEAVIRLNEHARGAHHEAAYCSTTVIVVSTSSAGPSRFSVWPTNRMS